jgi:hypothetical protein
MRFRAERAALVPEAKGRAWGVLMKVASGYAAALCSEPSVVDHVAEPVVVTLLDGDRVSAVCYNVPAAAMSSGSGKIRPDKGTAASEDAIVRRWVTSLTLIAAMTFAAQAQETRPDPWEPVRFLIGKWEGTASGEPGTGTVERSYEFILGDRFIQERNTSTYPPQGKNKDGEVHHHLGFISYDRARKALMLRQFHEEGFVNLYKLNPDLSSTSRLVFESESFENFDNSWRARETYEILSDSEFVETFELAPPGQDFQVYSRNHFRRVEYHTSRPAAELGS